MIRLGEFFREDELHTLHVQVLRFWQASLRVDVYYKRHLPLTGETVYQSKESKALPSSIWRRSFVPHAKCMAKMKSIRLLQAPPGRIAISFPRPPLPSCLSSTRCRLLRGCRKFANVVPWLFPAKIRIQGGTVARIDVRQPGFATMMALLVYMPSLRGERSLH